MTGVVGAMINVAGSILNCDIASDLESHDRGHRLFAYAYLYTRPDFGWLEGLVTAVVDREDTAFGQYWGIQAIGKLILFRGTGQVSPEIKRRLVDFSSKVPEVSDRKYELNQIIGGL